MQMSIKVGQVPKHCTVVETGKISIVFIGLTNAVPSQTMLNCVAVNFFFPLLWQRSGVIQMNDNLNAA